MNLFKAIPKTLMVAALFAATSLSTNATAYLIGEWDSGNSGDAGELASAQAAIAAYAGPASPLPALDPSLVFVAKTDDVDGYFQGGDDKIIEWTAPSGDVDFYVLTKWGQGQASFDTALHFVTAGNTLIYNPGGAGAPQGLSHIWIWHTPGTNVPDGGATAALLGLGVLALAAARRKS